MTYGVVKREEECRWLDAEYGAAVLYAIAILRGYGVGSEEFRAAEDAARDLWLRLREFQTESSNKGRYRHERSFFSGTQLI